MSSLIFITDVNQAVVATDTLATSLDGSPMFFTTKVLAIPHLKMLIAGTGAAGFLDKWFLKINTQMVVRGIDNLDFHSEENLFNLWQTYKQENSFPVEITSTIYHFGLSEEDSTIHTFVYRSKNDFQSETLPHGIGVKPECNLPLSNDDPYFLLNMMEEQRRNESLKPLSERVFIGGEIIVHILSKEGILIKTLARFDDFEITEQTIYENFVITSNSI